MRISHARNIVLCTFLCLFLSVASPAHADGASWQLTRNSGQAYGHFTSNVYNGYWHVSGTVDDYWSGDDCTRINIRAYNQESGTTYRVCGGLNKSFDLSGYTYGPIGGAARVSVTLCQDYTWGIDPCVTKTLYIT